MSTDWLSAGAPTTDGLTVVARLTAAATSVRAAFSTSASMTSPTYTPSVAPDSDKVVRCVATGLAEDTRWYYALEIDGVLDTGKVGRARTLPSNPTTVRIAHSSCQLSTSGGPVYQAIVDQDPLLFIHGGDEHYVDQTTNVVANYQAPFFAQRINASSRVLTENVVVEGVWDDHDYTHVPHSNCRGEGTYKATAVQVWKQLHPYWPLSDGSALYRTYAIGGVRFIITDLRYYGDPDLDTDTPSKSMLGATQKQWFKDTCLAAKEAGEFIVWLSSSVWPITGFTGTNADHDHWGAFSYERRELADFWFDNGITDLAIISGDIHALCYMASADFTTLGRGDWPVYQAAAMVRASAYRLANWTKSSPQTQGDGKYAILEITKPDDGGWQLRWEGHYVTDVAGDVVQFSHAKAFSRPRDMRAAVRSNGRMAVRMASGLVGIYGRSAA